MLILYYGSYTYTTDYSTAYVVVSNNLWTAFADAPESVESRKIIEGQGLS